MAPVNKVEGLVDRMVRGGSSPLERMEKALQCGLSCVRSTEPRFLFVCTVFSGENNAHTSAHLCRRGVLAMSVQANRGRWVVQLAR
jgi:hypothetical protein